MKGSTGMKTRIMAMTLAVACGWTWACGSDSSPTLSADHCTNNGGDSYCADLFQNRPYCIAAGDECPTVDLYGCVAEVAPECHEGLCGEVEEVAPECHAPCGEPGDRGGCDPDQAARTSPRCWAA